VERVSVAGLAGRLPGVHRSLYMNRGRRDRLLNYSGAARDQRWRRGCEPFRLCRRPQAIRRRARR
jgi:hypothetical protein